MTCVTTHRLIDVNDEIIPHIGDRSCLLGKLKEKCIHCREVGLQLR